jgi:hypothetical protein
MSEHFSNRKETVGSKFQRVFKGLPDLGRVLECGKNTIGFPSHTFWFPCFLWLRDARVYCEIASVRLLVANVDYGAERLPMSPLVGWDRGADRASNDADVSSILPIIPYGGFSPVRLEGWHIRRDLPEASISLSLLPACAD